MTIVVGYSPSGQGDAALRSAVREAGRRRQDLLIASHPYNDPELGPSVASAEAVQTALAAAGGAELRAEVRTAAEHEDIGEFLVTVAEESAASVIVIGLRRKSPIGKLNLGASARRLVLGAPCPVLTVKDTSTSTSGTIPAVAADA